MPNGAGSLPERPRPRRSGATSETSGPRARATPCHERWLPVIPWAATTTWSPSPHRPTCSDPPATGTSKLEYGASAIGGDANGRARRRRWASRLLRRWRRRLADRASSASPSPSSSASTASVCSPSQGIRVSGPSATLVSFTGLPGTSTGSATPSVRGISTSMLRAATCSSATTSSSRKHGPAAIPAADIAAQASSRVMSDAQRLDGGTDDVVEVVDPALAVGEAGVGGPAGLADQLGQRGELRLAADLDDEPAVGRPGSRP